jgi:two-component sensor histidine kinase
MSTIHELLYRSVTLVEIDFAEVLGTLIESLRDAYGVHEDRIRLIVTLQPVPVSMDLAVPLALIATELISNVFKHAFPDGAAGEVRITLAQADGSVELEVSDDGVGFTPPERTTSLGLMLVERLVRQVAGHMELGPPPGTSHRLTVRFE